MLRRLTHLWPALSLVAVVVVFFVLPIPLVGGLIAPGKLAKAHAEVELNCIGCHIPFGQSLQDGQCKDCHEEVRQDIAVQQGFHGRNPEVRNQPCSACHSEHKGRDHKLVSLETKSFDHTFTDFQLTGAHQPVACESCHQPGKAFAKAPMTCVGCHRDEDPHKGNLGTDCQACHNTATWNETIPFSHALTGFDLVGKHEAAPCESCHVNKRFQGTPTDCVSCHKGEDVHRGGNGDQCGDCHVADGWDLVDFNHAEDTKFPLLGAHAKVSCQSCHVQPAALVRLSTSCNDCHRADDAHKGSLGPDCAACHTSVSWTSAPLFSHAKTAFPLTGRHDKVACEACHSNKTFTAKGVRCADCHADDQHAGRFGKSPDCATCHSTANWQRWTFDHGRQAGFALDGKHAQLDCYACHAKPVTTAKVASTCVDCHKADDIHRGEFGRNCQSCHSTKTWKGAAVPRTGIKP